MKDDELYQKTLEQYNDPAFAQKYAKGLENLLDIWIFKEFLVNLKPNSYVLDVGCAAGRDSGYLLSQGYQAVGVDLSDELLKIARKKYPGSKFIKADFLRLPFNSDTFDGVWSHAALVHLPSQTAVKRALNEIYRVLKPEGSTMIFTKARRGDKKETAVAVDKLSKQERYFRYQDGNEFVTLVRNSGFKVLKSKLYNERDDKFGAGRDEDWILVVGKKLKSEMNHEGK